MTKPAKCPVCDCPDQKLLNPTEVARSFGCSARTIRNYCARGILRAFRSGGWRIDHKSVHAFIDRGGTLARSA